MDVRVNNILFIQVPLTLITILAGMLGLVPVFLLPLILLAIGAPTFYRLCLAIKKL